MKFNVANLKKRVTKTYETVVKKATTTAIPIIKQEAAKAIAKGTDEKIDVLFNILTISMVAAVIFTTKPAIGGVTVTSQPPVYFQIENLTINM